MTVIDVLFVFENVAISVSAIIAVTSMSRRRRRMLARMLEHATAEELHFLAGRAVPPHHFNRAVMARVERHAHAIGLKTSK